MALTEPDSRVLYNIHLLGNGDNLGNGGTWSATSNTFTWQFISATKDSTLYLIRTTDSSSGGYICLTTLPCDEIGGRPGTLPGCIGPVVDQCNSTTVAWKIGAWSSDSSDGIYLWNTVSDSDHRLYRVASDNSDFLNITDYRESFINTTWMKWNLVSRGLTTATSVPASIIDFSSTSTTPSSSTSSSIRNTSVITTTQAATSTKPTETKGSSSSSSTSTGAIVGGVLGTVCFLALLAAVVYIFWLRHRRNNTASPPIMHDKPELGGTLKQNYRHEIDGGMMAAELPEPVTFHEVPGSIDLEHYRGSSER